jgi:hypothetical protein
MCCRNVILQWYGSYKISGFHGDEDVDIVLLNSDAVCTRR